MLSAGNPYVLPAVVAGAVAYLGLSVFTGYSLPIRLGVLVVIVGVLPMVLNTVRPGDDYDDVGRGIIAEAGGSEDADPADDADGDGDDNDNTETRSA
ncbi:hypothetical protein JCM17823_27710 [Halorubrum gandharaense]